MNVYDVFVDFAKITDTCDSAHPNACINNFVCSSVQVLCLHYVYKVKYIFSLKYTYS